MSRTEYVKDRLGKMSGKSELQSLLESIINLSENKTDCANEIKEILSYERYSVEVINENSVIVGSKIIQKQEIKNNAHFINIQNQILTELDKAQVSISVAMAWFTNDTLFQKLMAKQHQRYKSRNGNLQRRSKC